jgi:glycosyltransferase involved in cell wall biosynthesis
VREYRVRDVGSIVVTNRWPRNLPEYEVVDDIPVYRVPLRSPEGSHSAALTYGATHTIIRHSIRRILRNHSVDLIHVQCVSTNGHYAYLSAQDLGVPLIVTSQGERLMDATGVYERSAFLNATLRLLLSAADGITACSAEVLRDLETYAGKSFGDRAQVIYNGVSPSDFTDESVEPYRHLRPYVLALGRWVPQKGFDVLLRAFAIAIESPAFGHDLLLAGDGPERASLTALAVELGLGDRVHLLGMADRRLTVSLFKGCSYFVCPSRYEPLGIVNLEAMAAGKAIVATRVGGVPELVRDGENGLLVEADSARALSAALLRLAEDESTRRELASRGCETVGDFTWPRIAERYLQCYRESGWVMRRVQATGGPS